MEVRLKEKYNKIIKDLATEIQKDNVMALPRITKVVINAGVGKIKDDKNLVSSFEKDITLIAGQKPVRRTAKKSISNFKVRQGDTVGISVTLRGERMWFFLDKLISIALPRVRDFRGISKKSFDGHGNYSLGVKEHTVFPEINPNTVDKIKSFEVSIVTSSDSDEDALKLLTKLGMPFEK